MLKKLGVIGGMGPEATSFYYARVIARTKAESDQEHINMIILSHATMPDREWKILRFRAIPRTISWKISRNLQVFRSSIW